MSEPVTHSLSIFHITDNRPAVEWVTQQLKGEVYDFHILESPSLGGESIFSPERLAFLSFVTPWTPQLAVVLEASRQFPDTQFELSFFGSVGTVLEDGVCFTLRDGAILTFSTSPYIPLFENPPRIVSLEEMCFRVLEYCATAGQIVPALLRHLRGMQVQPDGRELIGEDSGQRIAPDAFSNTKMFYMLPSRNSVLELKKQWEQGKKANG
jgi:hypothetical protein